MCNCASVPSTNAVEEPISAVTHIQNTAPAPPAEIAAAKEWETMKAREAEARQRKKEREEARMSSDPEYAAMMEERRKEYNRRHTEKRRLEHEALVALAKTDEEAARKLAEKRKYQSEATVRSYQKLKAEADAGNPEAVQRYEAHLAKRREEYHKKKEEKEVISA